MRERERSGGISRIGVGNLIRQAYRRDGDLREDEEYRSYDGRGDSRVSDSSELIDEDDQGDRGKRVAGSAELIVAT